SISQFSQRAGNVRTTGCQVGFLDLDLEPLAADPLLVDQLAQRDRKSLVQQLHDACVERYHWLREHLRRTARIFRDKKTKLVNQMNFLGHRNRLGGGNLAQLAVLPPEQRFQTSKPAAFFKNGLINNRTARKRGSR